MTEKWPEDRTVEFSSVGDDWGTITHVFHPLSPDTKIDLGNVTIEFYTIREVQAGEFGGRCLDND